MLKIEPAGDIESLRYNKISKSNILLPANEEICFNEINGNCLEIIAQIDMNSAPMIELNVLRSPEKEEFTRICFFANRGYRNWKRYDNWDTKRRMEASDGIISIDSSQSSLFIRYFIPTSRNCPSILRTKRKFRTPSLY